MGGSGVLHRKTSSCRPCIQPAAGAPRQSLSAPGTSTGARRRARCCRRRPCRPASRRRRRRGSARRSARASRGRRSRARAGDAELRHRLGHAGGEGEPGGGVAGRERGGGRHLAVPRLRDAHAAALGARALAEKLHRLVDDERVEADGGKARDGRSPPLGPADGEEHGGDTHVQLGVVGRVGELAQRDIDGRRRRRLDGLVDGDVELHELVEHAAQQRAGRSRRPQILIGRRLGRHVGSGVWSSGVKVSGVSVTG